MRPKGAFVRIGKNTVSVEVAQDTRSIRKGLSGRSSLATENGMLFLFPKPRRYRFWMRDMRFPIDIIWMRRNTVVEITEHVNNEFDFSAPRFYQPREKADRVLEVNAGFAKKKNISVGDPVAYHQVSRSLNIQAVGKTEKETWNSFIRQNQPTVGAFLETWEWGEFQKNLGLKTEYYFIKEENILVGVFLLIRYPLPFGMHYGYLPRGPIIAKDLIDAEMKYFEILKAIQTWVRTELPTLVFLRLEPSLDSLSEDTAYYGFHRPSYHIQPLQNKIVSLAGTEEEILAGFHSSTRSNIKRAIKRGVTVNMQKEINEDFYQSFFAMIQNTVKRTGSKKAYPNKQYFRTFFSSNRILGENDAYDPLQLSIVIFRAYQHGLPATAHIVLFFGTTATYLFGASHTKHLNSKADTYLHWAAMQEAKRRGMRYYDIGGIDEKIWPTLTQFKSQFGKGEIKYIGNIDVPLNLPLYHVYNWYRKIIKKINKQV